MIKILITVFTFVCTVLREVHSMHSHTTLDFSNFSSLVKIEILNVIWC